MIKITVALLMISTIGCTQSRIDTSIILDKVSKGKLSLKSEHRDLRLSQMDEDSLSQLAMRQKLANPEFKQSYLYTRYVDDGTWRYDFTYDYIQKQCNLRSARLSDFKNAVICQDKIIRCVYEKKKGDVNLISATECKKETKECNEITNDSKITAIDNSYCQKIFN